jgi:hypothetical protein
MWGSLFLKNGFMLTYHVYQGASSQGGSQHYIRLVDRLRIWSLADLYTVVHNLMLPEEALLHQVLLLHSPVVSLCNCLAKTVLMSYCPSSLLPNWPRNPHQWVLNHHIWGHILTSYRHLLACTDFVHPSRPCSLEWLIYALLYLLLILRQMLVVHKSTDIVTNFVCLSFYCAIRVNVYALTIGYLRSHIHI